MNKEEYILTCLIEECSEIQKCATKALRFGLNDKDPRKKDSLTNKEKLIDEINDCLAILDLLTDENILPKNLVNSEKIQGKLDRIIAFASYSRKLGKLNE